MVTHARGKGGPRAVRALNRPVRVSVEVNSHGAPVKVVSRGRVVTVQGIGDRWVVDTDWWRSKPSQRRYFSLVAHNGGEIAIFKDMPTGDWYAQRA